MPLRGEVDSVGALAIYEEFYAAAPFVQVTPAPPDMKHTQGTNHCLVHVVVDPRTRRAVCFGAIDNLVKGAAGQAIQNLNLMHGLDETAGLTATALWP